MKTNAHFGQNMCVWQEEEGEVPLDILFVSSSISARYLTDCQDLLASVFA